MYADIPKRSRLIKLDRIAGTEHEQFKEEC